MNVKTLGAFADYLRGRPSTATEQDDFEAGWLAAIEAAADRVEDFQDEHTFYRAGQIIRMELE
jgi:hypothetical protein